MHERARHPDAGSRRAGRIPAFLCLLLALAAAPLSCFCAELGVLRIGVADALTGKFAMDSPSIGRAAHIAVAQANDRGGVRGMRVELVELDDQCSRVKGREVAERLAGMHVSAVLGHTCTDAMEAALPVYARAGIVAVSPSVTKDSIADGLQPPLFFRTICPLKEEIRVSADFAASKLGVRKAAFLHDGTEFGRSYAMGVRDLLERKGVKTVLCDVLNPLALDYLAAVRSLARSGADTLFLGAYGAVCERILQQLEMNGYAISVVGPDAMQGESGIGCLKLHLVKGYVAFTDECRNKSLSRSVAELHRNWFGTEPGPYFYSAYAAMQALLGALEQAESLAPQDVAKALREGSWKTPLGKLGFDGSGNPTGVATAVYRSHQGRLEKCW